MSQHLEEEPIPKLPRAKLLGKLSLNSLVRIGMFATMLYAVVMMRKPCSEGIGRFIGSFDPPVSIDAGASRLSDNYPGFQLMTAEEALKLFPDSPTAVVRAPGSTLLDAGTDAGSTAGSLDAGPPESGATTQRSSEK